MEKASFSRRPGCAGESRGVRFFLPFGVGPAPPAARSCAPTINESAPMRIPAILLVAALALAGCNANESPNLSPQSGRFGVSDVQDPIHQAQTSGFYAGR